jgi:methylenetetrahydrofolate reductase (NADPH)
MCFAKTTQFQNDNGFMIYLELVPNDMHTLLAESQWALSTIPTISGINIPDILRVKNRSFDAAKHLTKHGIGAIPHIRICDYSMDGLIALCDHALSHGIQRMLLISGDPHPFHETFDNNMINVIKRLTRQYPAIDFYAGHDPYRTSFKKEFNYSKEKLAAGAKGLFTQPIFSPHMVHLLLDQDFSCDWFIGISPVLKETSLNYWTNRNHVVFPKSFSLSLEDNIQTAKSIIKLCQKKNQNVYIMPIKTNIHHYLPPIFNG